MLFGRQRLWKNRIGYGAQFPCSKRQVIFNPTPSGAPMNQYKRYLPLKKGEQTLIIALEPLADEPEIIWGFGICVRNRFLTGIFR